MQMLSFILRILSQQVLEMRYRKQVNILLLLQKQKLRLDPKRVNSKVNIQLLQWKQEPRLRSMRKPMVNILNIPLLHQKNRSKVQIQIQKCHIMKRLRNLLQTLLLHMNAVSTTIITNYKTMMAQMYKWTQLALSLQERNISLQMYQQEKEKEINDLKE